MKISIHTLGKLNVSSIADAIEEIAREHDSIASGIIGPSFSTSGPGSGWSKQHDCHDYARRALGGDYGAGSYIDSGDGREATLNDDDEIEWSEESAVEIELPSIEEALNNPEEWAIIKRDAASYGVAQYYIRDIIQAIENPDKSEACNWSTEATYGVLCSNGDGEDLITIEVQVGEWNGRFFIRTADDAGGGDDCDNTLYADIDDAIAAAKEWAEDHDETPDKNNLAEEIAKDGWWACEMSAEEILEIANAAEGHQSGSCLWISNKGGTHWDTGNTIRVEGWEDYITISANHDSIEAALMSIQSAINTLAAE
jgi:hypothetical protein